MDVQLPDTAVFLSLLLKRKPTETNSFSHHFKLVTYGV
ncbi:hypothetical protein PMI41_03044 [Phyllobacterium sp. YR531]|nr:hypothetical protein PMI41_03044 [Phyllobacterium sp. YR531]